VQAAKTGLYQLRPEIPVINGYLSGYKCGYDYSINGVTY